jgi:uncharacterized protein YwqG
MNRRELFDRLRRYWAGLIAPAMFASCSQSPKKNAAAGVSIVNDDDALAKLAPWREKHRRTAWRPVVKAEDGAITASKFSGLPWLAAAEAWPSCTGCHKPLQLFLQLNLAELPAEINERFGDGLLQLFYCCDGDSTCPIGGGGWEPFDEAAKLVRIVHPTPQETAPSLPVDPNYFPAKAIVDWQPVVDYPNPQEHDALGLTYEYEHGEHPSVVVKCPELGLEFTPINVDFAEQAALALFGDKLAGWPHWVQNIEYPRCPSCQRPMELVFQIDSEDNLPYMFGDSGAGYITQCPRHKEIVAFGWACY